MLFRSALIAMVPALFCLACNDVQGNKEKSIVNYGEIVGAANIVIPPEKAKLMAKHFRELYRRCEDETTPPGNPDPLCTSFKIDSLSKAVWFDKNAIKLLYDKIYTDSGLDGMRIYLSAYDKIEPKAVGQKYPNQTTVFIVATSKSNTGGRHKDEWGVFLTEDFKKDPDYHKILDALNHGELCPEVCN